LLLALVGPGAIALLSDAVASSTSGLAPRAFTLLLFVVVTVSVLLIARVQGPGLRRFGFAAFSWISIPAGLALAAFFIVVYGPAAYAALEALGLSGFDPGLATLQLLPVWYLVIVVVLVASGEEWLYRAYAIESLQQTTGRPWLAGLVSLAAFTLVHLPFWGPGPALSIVVSGAIFTLLYLWRRDIVLLIVGHVATDLYGIVIASV
jgi:membrane protease YdiL (CAAX protease family)